eukprot:411741-Pelagomonas_calceolata.AAC.2
MSVIVGHRAPGLRLSLRQVKEKLEIQRQDPSFYGTLVKGEQGVCKEEVPGSIPCGLCGKGCPLSVGVIGRLFP